MEITTLSAILLLSSTTITSYRSVPSQTDSTPFITASNTWVHESGVAVSRDLHQRYGGPLAFGDLVYIDGIGFKFVNDLMHKRHKKHIDVWVDSYEKERGFHAEWKNKKTKVWHIQTK